MRRGRSVLVVLVTFVALATSACGAELGGRLSPSAAGPIPDRDALPVITTTTVLADIVRSIGGPRVAVRSIVPAGVGPEDYEPKPDDARAIADARLIVSNGVGLDDFLGRLLASGGGGAAQVVLGAGLPAITIDGEPNPHFFLDPTMVRDGYVPKIVAALSRLDPDGAQGFEERAADYSRALDALDAELRAEVAKIPPANRKLVTFHDAFPYFARHFGFELVGVVVANVGQEPTAAELAALVDKVRATGVKAVFSEAQFNPELARTLADEAGIERVVTTLYNDALGPPPADSYAGLMRSNVRQIVEALR